MKGHFDSIRVKEKGMATLLKWTRKVIPLIFIFVVSMALSGYIVAALKLLSTEKIVENKEINCSYKSRAERAFPDLLVKSGFITVENLRTFMIKNARDWSDVEHLVNSEFEKRLPLIKSCFKDSESRPLLNLYFEYDLSYTAKFVRAMRFMLRTPKESNLLTLAEKECIVEKTSQHVIESQLSSPLRSDYYGVSPYSLKITI